MSFQHAVVWLDHLRAVVIDFSIDADHVHLVASPTEQRQVHRRAGTVGAGKHGEEPAFFDGIVEALGDARDVLVVGPGMAKHAFMRDLQHRHPKWHDRVVGVVTMDHPQVDELLSSARRYFKRVDSLRGV